MKDRDQQILRKIRRYCREIAETHKYFGNDDQHFMNQETGFVYRNSITMPILQIGELAKNLSEEFQKENNQIPWREIKGMRDIFAHHYGAVDYEMVWETSHKDIQELEHHLDQIEMQLAEMRHGME